MRPAAYHVSFYAGLLIARGAADLAAAIGVLRRRGSPGRNSLCVAILATAVWSFAYALELSAPRTGESELWGALKYIGVMGLPPAWLVFALQYTGRMARPSRRFLAALTIEPLIVGILLAVPATRHLIRFYPPGPPRRIPTAGAVRLRLWTGVSVQRARSRRRVRRPSRPAWSRELIGALGSTRR